MLHFRLQWLQLHLLWEASLGEASFYWPYVKTLPPSYGSAPYFDERDLEALSAVPCVQARLQEASEQVKRTWREAAPALQRLPFSAAKWRSLGAWRWSAATLGTRTMYLEAPELGVETSPGPDPGALTPIGDFHNHSSPPAPLVPTLVGTSVGHARTDASPAAGTGRFDPGADAYRLFAGSDGVLAGDQVFLEYGRYTNAQLMELYGFVLAANPHDTAPLAVSSFPAAAAAASGEVDDEERCLTAAGTPSWALLRALRLAAVSSEERKRCAWRALRGQAISEAGERRAFAWLETAILESLKAVKPAVMDSAESAPGHALDWLKSYARHVKLAHARYG